MRRAKSSNEIDDFHPLVADWLKENGFTFKHEVKMPLSGRADFVAHHPDGRELIIECKIDRKQFSRSIAQVLDYQYQLGKDYQACLALPRSNFTKKIEQHATGRNVRLLLFDYKPQTSSSTEKRDHSYPDLNLELIILADKCRSQSERIIQEILDFHEAQRTDPYNDLLKASKMARDSIHLLDEAFGITSPSSSEIFKQYTSAMDNYEAPEYESLRDVVEFACDLAYFRAYAYDQAIKAIQKQKQDFTTEEDRILARWQAEKKAEFSSMTDAIDRFDYEEEGDEILRFINFKGEEISLELDWTGSAHSFDNAVDWWAWRKEHHRSWFDGKIK